MKTYKFANITVRPYPNMCDVNNKWIFTPKIGVVVNVSQKYKTDIVEAIKQKGIEYFHFPLDEEVPDIGWENIKKAVKVLFECEEQCKHILVHCDGGNHRSRLVVEAYHYAKTGMHYIDEYKGFDNHLIYDCRSGYLLPLEGVEAELKNIKNGTSIDAPVAVHGH